MTKKQLEELWNYLSKYRVEPIQGFVFKTTNGNFFVTNIKLPIVVKPGTDKQIGGGERILFKITKKQFAIDKIKFPKAPMKKGAYSLKAGFLKPMKRRPE